MYSPSPTYDPKTTNLSDRVYFKENFVFTVFFQENISKRLSLPANIRLPPSYLSMINVNQPADTTNWDRPLSRIDRRKNLIEIGTFSLFKKLHSDLAHFEVCYNIWTKRSWTTGGKKYPENLDPKPFRIIPTPLNIGVPFFGVITGDFLSNQS